MYQNISFLQLKLFNNFLNLYAITRIFLKRMWYNYELQIL